MVRLCGRECIALAMTRPHSGGDCPFKWVSMARAAVLGWSVAPVLAIFMCNGTGDLSYIAIMIRWLAPRFGRASNVRG